MTTLKINSDGEILINDRPYTLEQIASALDRVAGYTVFDWVYIDPKTNWYAYARTPERAKKLIADGVKLIPVYTKNVR